jgi:hypothetical protein
VIFLTSAFLWATITVGVPIAIALWNRRQTQREDFGAFFLLRDLLQSTQKRIRLLELLKLLNRIALITFLILIFAEPQKKEIKLAGADEGFALILDVGRAMQARSGTGESLIDLQLKKVHSILRQISSSAQGAIFFVSDRCESMKLEGGRLTATAEHWNEELQMKNIPYANAATTMQALTGCLSRIDGLFEQKEIFSTLISPMPATLNEAQLAKSKLVLDVLPAPKLPVIQPVEVRQEPSSEKVRLLFTPPDAGEAMLIREGRAENLGTVNGSLDLLAGSDAWIWIRKPTTSDPWINSNIISVQRQLAYQVSVWAMKETPGFLSLVSALRNYPDMKIIKQVGGEPSGDAVIVYGSFPFSITSLKRAWLFADPAGQQPFVVRDHKQWSSAASSPDLERAFHIRTQDGQIFIRKYALYDLDQFEILEGFEDGAPSLLAQKKATSKIWVSPFDLEDLTTDLTLEPTFIPYLYRHLEKWLSLDENASEMRQSKPLWLMKGTNIPVNAVVSNQRWPGIYGDSGRFRVVEPQAIPQEFLNVKQDSKAQETREESVSQRPMLFKWLVTSLFLELLLCLATARVVIFCLLFVLAPSLAHAIVRPIGVGYFRGIDSDRKTALEQMIRESDHLSNLDFAKPLEVNFDRLWESSYILASSSRSFGPFTKEEREKIREYCERGGLLVFDDPLASGESSFYRSVKSELALIFPGRPLKTIPKEDVIFRTFYLLSEVSGRKLASPNLEGIDLDRRWVAIFSFNDLLGAALKSASGDYAYSVTPYGIEQRVLARRLFVNLEMYSVATDYKDDAIHLPYILKRRVK